jgi:hypothetical protein
VVARAKSNQNAKFASDHPDVYVATSMRERHEFSAINRRSPPGQRCSDSSRVKNGK